MSHDPNSNNRGGYVNPYAQVPRNGYQTGAAASGNTGQDDNSPFYKPQAPSISLPKGGGALKGIDEKFTVNAVNGTAALEIPLPLTPGRNEFTPALSLQYNSGSGNSEFGLGWSLSLPSIQRRTDRKIPQYRDYEESDVFVLAGAEDLVPEQEEKSGKWVIKRTEITTGGITYTVTRYRPRMEGLYARIEFIRKAGVTGGWWRVTTKDNITTWYGLTAGGRIADPEYPGHVFKWLPEIVCDDKGHVQRYEYVAENADNRVLGIHESNRVQGGQLTAANTYLKRIQYCNQTPYTPVVVSESTAFEPAVPAGTFLMEAVLDYGDHDTDFPQPESDTSWPGRHDPFSDYRPGFEIRTYRKCKRVLMFHRFTELNGGVPTLVRSLDLAWAHDGLTGDELVEADYIISITQTGYTLKPGNTYYRKSLPPLTFDYEPLQWDTSLKTVSREDVAGTPQGLTGPYQWTDFYGEGISGILTEQGNGWFYKRNLGDGHFTPMAKVAEKPSFTGLGNGGLQWQDLEADGGRQVVAPVPPVAGFWQLDDKDKWEPFRAFESNINIDWDSPYTLRLDLDGDGRPDTLLAGDQVWTWYQNKGRKGHGEGGRITTERDEEKGPVLIFRDPVQSVFLADMSGDGLTDLVRIRNGSICYWPNMGYGKFGAQVIMDDAPQFDYSDQYNPIYLTLADISGTGAADLIYLGSGACTAWINLAGNGWSEAREISYLPSTDAYSKIAVLDFLANGTGCIVWSSPLPAHAQAPIRYIDLMGGKKPYLLNAYHNGLGKTTGLVYKSSTQFYLEDRREGLHWATKLPFPVHCLQQMQVTDTVSQTEYTQSYRYHHGYYDQREREFRGFGRVDTLDTEQADTGPGALDQPPVLTKTWYHTGAWTLKKKLEDRFAEEFFPIPDWPGDFNKIILPAGLNPQEFREAHRAVKGSPLRQEVYAQDGSPDAGKPYTVTAYAYQVNLVQPLHTNQHASFYAYQEQSLAFHCERNADDPRVLQELTLEIDDYGNIKQSAQVVYPRKDIPTGLPGPVEAAQERMHITASKTEYTNYVIDNTHHTTYRLPLPWEVRSYEVNRSLTPPATLWTAATLKPLVESATAVDFTVDPAPGQKRLLSHSRVRYRTDSATGKLAFGVLESRAIEYERYQLAFTEDILNKAYSDYDGSGDLIPDTNRVSDDMLSLGGYKDLDEDGNWWIRSGRAWYGLDAAAQFFTPEKFIDPWKQKTIIRYWGSYWLLPRQVEDAKENVTEVTGYDWRSLQPVGMKDPNNNISEVLYDALGLPVAMALKGKGSEADTLTGIDPEDSGDIAKQAAFWTSPQANAKDLLDEATWRCVYDLSAQPAAVGMITRVQHHVIDPDSPRQITLSYTDGLGRVIMEKAQCAANSENGNRHWIGTGRTIYNNKGSEVMQYEPYFSATHACDTAEQAASDGVSARLHYDPLGRMQRTDYPDGTYEKTLWTAWDQLVYDRNDTVADSAWYAAWSNGTTEQKDAAAKALAHNNTPTRQYLDTLARPCYMVQYLANMDLTPPPGKNPIHSYTTLDVVDNRLQITDGRGKDTLQYRYNMVQSPCWQQSLDSGVQRVLVDVSGQPLCGWDADDRNIRITSDELRRPLTKSLWLYDGVEAEWALEQTLEVKEYGEGQTDDQDHNLRGQLYRSFDGAGVVTTPGYDFKSNPLSAIRQFTADPTKHPDWTGSVPLEIDGSSNPVLYTTATTYDALNRPVTLTTPEGAVTAYAYNETGLLLSVDVAGVHGLSDDMVDSIVYDAKGQRLKIQYGNGTTTRYTYDPATFRVTRIRTTRHSDSAELQDLRYWYDPVGNVTLLKDLAQQEVFFANTVVSADQDHTYDALYRLIESEGRELVGNSGATTNSDSTRSGKHPMPFANVVSPTNDPAAVRRYKEQYSYDAVGNMLELFHDAGGAGNWTRTFTISTTSNRMTGCNIGSSSASAESYAYDNRGNLTGGLNHLVGMLYNAENRLEEVKLTATRSAFYQYDSNGHRVRKTIKESSAVTEVRKYVGSWETYSKFTGSSLTIERESLHVSDNTGRIVLIETQVNVVTPVPVQRYQYSNHLGSATLELDEVGAVISYEEYYPYGSTSYQAGKGATEVSLKRYRYTGKERDEETGLYYHGARYYIPWLARWSAVDPLQGEMPEWSAYSYSFCNPVMFNDPSGMVPEKKDPPKSNIEGQEAAYTTIVNTYDHNNQLVEGSSETMFLPVEELPADFLRGEYIKNIFLPDPDRPTIKDGDLIVANIGHETNEFIPYDLPNSKEFVAVSSTQEESILETVWNSSVARAMVPDKVSFSIGGDVAFGIGIGVQAANITILTRGQDPGVYVTPTYNLTVGIMAKAEGSINFSTGYYTGDPRDISSSMLLGVTHAGSVSAKALIGVSVGVSVSETDDLGGRFINKNIGIGIGASFSLEYQRQVTPTYGPLWQWKNNK